MIIITILICVYVLSAIICHHVAKDRGANAGLWGVLGSVFGPLAIPFVFMIKSSGKSK